MSDDGFLHNGYSLGLFKTAGTNELEPGNVWRLSGFRRDLVPYRGKTSDFIIYCSTDSKPTARSCALEQLLQFERNIHYLADPTLTGAETAPLSVVRRLTKQSYPTKANLK